MIFCRKCDSWFKETEFDQAQPYRDGASPYNTDRFDTPATCPYCGSEDWSEAREVWRCIDFEDYLVEEYDKPGDAEARMENDPEVAYIEYVIEFADYKEEERVSIW